MATNWNGSPKDPQDIRDYAIDWSEQLGNLTITTSTWQVANGDVNIVDFDHTNTVVTVRLSGGTNNTISLINNHVVLSDGQELDLTAQLKVRDRDR